MLAKSFQQTEVHFKARQAVKYLWGKCKVSEFMQLSVVKVLCSSTHLEICFSNIVGLIPPFDLCALSSLSLSHNCIPVHMLHNTEALSGFITARSESRAASLPRLAP